jgi:hypothetical protein
VESEYRYFEFVNTIRLLSRQLYTQINADGGNAAHQIDDVLLELKKKLLNHNESYSSRFLNEEVRSLEFYEDGSALRHLATIKELFASHLALLWMSVKHLRGSLQDKSTSPSETEKLSFLEKTIKGLLSSDHLMNEIRMIASDEDDSKNQVTKYSIVELRTLFDSFENDRTPANDAQKLQKLQQVYAIIHEHFAEKAGNRGIIHELADDENEILFRKESKVAGNANLAASFLDASVDKSNPPPAKRSALLPDINSKSLPPKRDLLKVAAGDDNIDGEESEVDVGNNSEAAYANADVDRDFAYLKYHLGQNPKGKEWKTLYDDKNDFIKVVIKGKFDRESVSKITLRCEAEIEHVPKNIILKAITDMNLRAKWDHSLGKLEVLEYDKRNDYFYVKTEVSVPEHMQAREAVLVRKVMRDFPDPNKCTIVQRSVDHARCPNNPSQSVRANFSMNGLIVEDDSSLRGTKLSWILVSDLGGCLPSTQLARQHVHYQKKFLHGLAKAANQIAKGQLK